MKLSVIIACYNGAETLADQLDGLAAQSCSQPWEVIFADNRSTDNSRAIAEQYKDRLPNLKIIDASEKQGKSFALNKGILAARGDSIAFADADDQVAPGWLAALGNALETHDLVACRWDIDALNSDWTKQHRRNVQLDGAEMYFEPTAVMRVRFRDDIKSIYMQSRNYAEYNVFLSKRYRSYGEPMQHPWRNFFTHWLQLIRTSRRLTRGPGPRAVWTGKLGWQLGLLRGVLKYRVPLV